MMHLSARWFVATMGATCTIVACARAHAPVVESAATPTAAIFADSLHAVIARGLADHAYPGAIAVVGNHAGVIAQAAIGHLDWSASPAPDEHTLWDLASLTKVVGLTSAVMQLVAAHRLDLDAPVQRYLPAWTGPNKDRATVRQLITHTAGLPAFVAYDRVTTNADSMAALMFATPLDTTPGARMVYSDIGAYVLGRVVQAVSGQSLDTYLHDHVFEPAGMHETMFNPPATLVDRIAPTEVDPRRGGLLRGRVHDERAYYLGGVSGHAGLFSSAHDLARFAQMYLDHGTIDGVRVLDSATIVEFSRREVADRSLGWQKPTRGDTFAGHEMPEDAIGHTGFTGTSIWIDPPDDIYIILLSNRVNPSRANSRIGPVRTQLADAVMHLVLAAHPSTPRP